MREKKLIKKKKEKNKEKMTEELKKLISTTVREGREDRAGKLIKAITQKNGNQMDLLVYLKIFLMSCKEHDASLPLIKSILISFSLSLVPVEDNEREKEKILDVFIIIVSLFLFEESLITFVKEKFTFLTKYNVVERMIMVNHRGFVPLVWQRLKGEEISLGGVIRLLDLAKEQNNEITINFLSSLLHKEENYADIPLYVNRTEEEDHVLNTLGRERVFNLELTEKEIKETFKNDKDEGRKLQTIKEETEQEENGNEENRKEETEQEETIKEEDEIKEETEEEENTGEKEEMVDDFVQEYKNKFKFTLSEKYREHYSEDSLNDIIKSIYSSYTNLDGPLSLDRIYGPLNKGCYECGIDGCRMLSCSCHDEEDWFSSVCDGCFKKIRDVSHCLRYPVKDGGWIGCFCSMTCLVQNPPLPIDECTEIRLDCMEDVISSLCIYDRKEGNKK
jgi:hypothetical protein